MSLIAVAGDKDRGIDKPGNRSMAGRGAGSDPSRRTNPPEFSSNGPGVSSKKVTSPLGAGSAKIE